MQNMVSDDEFDEFNAETSRIARRKTQRFLDRRDAFAHDRAMRRFGKAFEAEADQLGTPTTVTPLTETWHMERTDG